MFGRREFGDDKFSCHFLPLIILTWHLTHGVAAGVKMRPIKKVILRYGDAIKDVELYDKAWQGYRVNMDEATVCRAGGVSVKISRHLIHEGGPVRDYAPLIEMAMMAN